jgi:hypothetical protein
MAINFELRYESGGLVNDDLGAVDAKDLPGMEDRRFPYLRLVDPFGTTVFSHAQVQHAVIEELERYSAERPSRGIDQLLALARRCVKEPTTSLWLLGD